MAKKEDKQQNEARVRKIIEFIDKLDAQDLNNELKTRKLFVMGSSKEKKERLRKAMENNADLLGQAGELKPAELKKQSKRKEGLIDIKKSNIVSKIEEMGKKREERRKKMDNDKKTRQANLAQHEAEGKKGDLDFSFMINNLRDEIPKPLGHISPEGLKIVVCVRKRPIFQKEEEAGENDCVTCSNPKMYVHECKYRVDGITKYVDNQTFSFDNAFSEKEDTDLFYKYSIKPSIGMLYKKGTLTCFAYGQTGSGKTFTMTNLQKSSINDLFYHPEKTSDIIFTMSYFEIYGNKLFDLLNERNTLIVLEDKNQVIQIQGLTEIPALDPSEMMKLMEKANALRTTHATTANDTSSRSHSICHILIKDSKTKKQVGKLSLVDLAGSERAQDCQSNDKVRRLEGAEINKSLLALKECIRALDTKGTHIPFRASKLTMVLRDSFIGKSDKIRIVMVACISPGSSSSDHTLNTLRYAERLKERTNIDYESIVKKQYEEEENIRQIEEAKNVKAKEAEEVEPDMQKDEMQSNSNEDMEEKKDYDDRNIDERDLRVVEQDDDQERNREGSEEINIQEASNDNDGNENIANIREDEVEEHSYSKYKKDPQIKEAEPDPEPEQDIEQDQEANIDIEKYTYNKDRAPEQKVIQRPSKIKAQYKMSDKQDSIAQQKADEMMEEEQALLNEHISSIENDAYILNEETELLNEIQNADDYDIVQYMKQLEAIVEKKKSGIFKIEERITSLRYAHYQS